VGLKTNQPEEETLMNEIFEAIEAESEKFKEVNAESGKELSVLIEEANKMRKKIEALEEEIKREKKQYAAYLYDLIPEQMNTMGLDKVEADGSVVSLKSFVSARMPTDPIEKQQALEYLRSIGKGDFIKNDLSISFGVSEDDKCLTLQKELEGYGYHCSSKVWIEPPTLKKLIKDCVENGENIDLERFNTYLGTTAVIKGAKI
jgi:hypothetical protein